MNVSSAITLKRYTPFSKEEIFTVLVFLNFNTATIGAGSRNSISSFFAGNIDEFRVYNRVLSNQEINDLSNQVPNSGGSSTQISGSCSQVLNSCISGIFSDS